MIWTDARTGRFAPVPAGSVQKSTCVALVSLCAVLRHSCVPIRTCAPTVQHTLSTQSQRTKKTCAKVESGNRQLRASSSRAVRGCRARVDCAAAHERDKRRRRIAEHVRAERRARGAALADRNLELEVAASSRRCRAGKRAAICFLARRSKRSPLHVGVIVRDHEAGIARERERRAKRHSDVRVPAVTAKCSDS